MKTPHFHPSRSAPCQDSGCQSYTVNADECPLCYEMMEHTRAEHNAYLGDYNSDEARALRARIIKPCSDCGEYGHRPPYCQAASPQVAATAAGPQYVAPGMPAPRISDQPLRARRPQTDKPLALEMPAIEAKQGRLF